MEKLERIRTIKQCISILRDKDENTVISEWCIRNWVKDNKVKSFKSGNKWYVSLDNLLEYINRPLSDQLQEV